MPNIQKIKKKIIPPENNHDKDDTVTAIIPENNVIKNTIGKYTITTSFLR